MLQHVLHAGDHIIKHFMLLVRVYPKTIEERIRVLSGAFPLHGKQAKFGCHKGIRLPMKVSTVMVKSNKEGQEQCDVH